MGFLELLQYGCVTNFFSNVYKNLQQQQCYDREVALGEIEYSRKMLLEKLKEYKGQHFEVIHETSNFAGETVEHDNDLLLPPYPSRVPCNQGQTGSTASRKGFGHFIGLVAKTVFPLVGMVCVLNMTGFGQNLGKRSNHLKVLDIFQQPTIKENRSVVQCPHGKFLVVENGEARSLVKERVEILFVSVAMKPDINFGSG
ncbi:hypothetical protein EZV62_011470 [Acer yangbiense]|uniref:Uncharacterized protein n=1 Tax=Acer yangbiense TaxID=1000413 RepID=A0A5C7I7R7_9ROSI|nr:hypothetical protein EZV62_011470 [Acer yangbiense]